MRTIYPAVLTAIVATFFLAACGGGTTAPTRGPEDTVETGVPTGLPLWRYVNSGWVSPLNEQTTNAFSRELRAVVITSAQEMEDFNRAVVSKRVIGTSTTLSRPEFPGSVVLAVYLMWLPVQGDPLSVVGLEVDGNRALVKLELEDDAQGREYPYLFAPMTMVTVDRSVFPSQGPIEFEFRLDSDTVFIVADTLE
ncbi:MAG: hypothetical protein BZY87_03020 [SAR202 cluster bacterium Io17-Chloro-G6]|nr:MAG: hypothetical protein BZY87_03020 [SAR202 cluster bacterium Io17-Chloro-G6]